LSDGFLGGLDASCSVERESDWPLRVLDRIHGGADASFAVGAGGIGLRSFQGVFGIAEFVLQRVGLRNSSSMGSFWWSKGEAEGAEE
jgi:hypothetical protein